MRRVAGLERPAAPARGDAENAMSQSGSKQTVAGQPDRPDREARLDYIHAMLGQLRGMAEAEKLDVLAYLIDMARVEVGEVLRAQLPQRARPRRSSHHR